MKICTIKKVFQALVDEYATANYVQYETKLSLMTVYKTIKIMKDKKLLDIHINPYKKLGNVYRIKPEYKNFNIFIGEYLNEK